MDLKEGGTYFGKRARARSGLGSKALDEGALEKHEKWYANEYTVKWKKLHEYMQKSALYDPNAGD